MKCPTCNVKDDTFHVLNSCDLHEVDRALMLQRLGHNDKVSALLSSNEAKVVEELAEFLTRAEDLRIKIQEENKNKQ